MIRRVALVVNVTALAACATAPPPPPAPPCRPLVVLVAPFAPGPDAVTPPAPPPPPPSAEPAVTVAIDPDDASSGRPNARVTLVVFTELECPFCARFAATVDALRAQYRPDQLRIVWKHQPLAFHPHAREAAEAAAGVRALAGDAAFWRFTARAFADHHALDRDHYRRWAAEAGVRDPDALLAGLDDHRWAAAVDADVREAARLEVTGVPTSFVDGIQIVGAQPLERLVRAIDDELAK